jgi:hypothetical protein
LKPEQGAADAAPPHFAQPKTTTEEELHPAQNRGTIFCQAAQHGWFTALRGFESIDNRVSV